MVQKHFEVDWKKLYLTPENGSLEKKGKGGNKRELTLCLMFYLFKKKSWLSVVIYACSPNYSGG
jgi:hypothetical protein